MCMHVGLQAVSAQEAARPRMSSDAVAAAAEAQMAQHAGDVGEWLGVDSGAAPALQVALAVAPGRPYPSAASFCICENGSVVRHGNQGPYGQSAWADILFIRESVKAGGWLCLRCAGWAGD